MVVLNRVHVVDDLGGDYHCRHELIASQSLLLVMVRVYVHMRDDAAIMEHRKQYAVRRWKGEGCLRFVLRRSDDQTRDHQSCPSPDRQRQQHHSHNAPPEAAKSTLAGPLG
jgi:hypothetical protein